MGSEFSTLLNGTIIKIKKMELIFGFGNIGIGIMMTLIGFKIYNPFKGKNDPEKEELWFKKFGTFFKIGGIAMLLFGILKTINNL